MPLFHPQIAWCVCPKPEISLATVKISPYQVFFITTPLFFALGKNFVMSFCVMHNIAGVTLGDQSLLTGVIFSDLVSRRVINNC